ncbi:YybH family protein [Bacteroidota bacterium]
MKKLKLKFPIFFLLFGILLGCAQYNKNADVEADIAAIKEVLGTYILGVNNDDLDLFISAWCDDAIRMESGYPAIIGKEIIRAHFKKIGFDNFNCNIDLYGEIEVEVSGDLAFSHANYILSITPKEGGSTTLFDGKVVDIYKRQADGSWKIYIDSPNSNPTWSNDTLSPGMLEKQNPYDPKF